MTVKYVCNSGHEGVWTNSETVGCGTSKMPMVNLLMIVYAFLTGMPWEKLKVLHFLTLKNCN